MNGRNKTRSRSQAVQDNLRGQDNTGEEVKAGTAVELLDNHPGGV